MGILSNPITWGFTIVAALIGVLGAFAVQRHNALRSASAEFRAALFPALTMLRNKTDNPAAILERHFVAHEAAVLEFSHYLGYFKRKGLLASWRLYYCHEKAGVKFLEQYTTVGVGAEEGRRNRQKAIERLERLTSYGRYT